MPILFALALRHPQLALALILSALAGLSIGLGAGTFAGMAAFAVSAAITSAAAILQNLSRAA
jgi:uncharacterized transporter YbjL